MTRYSIGWHVNGSGGHRGALGEYIAQLEANGHRPVVNVVDDAGLAVEIVNADGIAVYRKDQWSAAPDYNQGPEAAAAERWDGIKALIPPEIEAVKDRVVIEVTNEPDRARADWLGRFMKRISELGNADGYAIGGPSFATGNPEISDWETPGMLAYLDYVGMNADMNVICLHEYSLNPDDITEGSPWLVGRYQFMFDVCEAHGLLKPPVIITELGWSYRTMPGSGVMEQIAWAAKLYGNIPVCWWTLGSGSQWGDLPQTLSAYVDDVTAWMLANSKPEPEPEPPPPPPDEPPDEEPPVNPIRELWEQSVQLEKDTGISFNPNFAFVRWAADNGYQLVHKERALLTSDGRKWNAQAFRDLRGEKPRVMAFYEQPWEGMGKVRFVTVDDLEPEPEPEPFSFKAWPTDYKTVTQTFGARPEYYGQFGLPGHEGEDLRAPNGTPIYAVADGTVYLVTGDEGNYGRQIRIDHGNGYKTVYAHNLQNLVQVGQRVTAGQQIARADSTGNSQGSHLHLTLKRDGQPAPGYPSDIADPTPFILPHRPDFPNLPPAAHGVTICDVSAHQGAIDFHKMMRRGTYAVYIRGSIGGSGLDTRFAHNWKAIKDTPMLRGMYHLFKSDSTAEQNLANIVKAVNEHGAGDLRIAIDVEPVGSIRVNGDEVKRFIPLFRDTFGYEPLIYTGLWIRNPKHAYGDLSWFATSLLWLAEYWQSPPQPGQHPHLPDGVNLDRLLAHQWTSTYVDEAAWGVSSGGLDVNVVYDINRLTVAGKEPEPPPPPPPKITVDLLGYMMPPQARGPLYELRRQDGSQERVQSHVEGNVFYYVKGSGGVDGKGEWEELTFDADYIYRGKDTSPRQGEWYALRDDITKKWSSWAPRRMGVGDSYLRNPWVVFFRKDNCEEVSRGQQRTTITLEAVHPSWTSPYGITLKDVIEVVVRHADGRFFERTWFAKGYGLVGFEGETVKGYISELHEPGQRPDQQREQGCFS